MQKDLARVEVHSVSDMLARKLVERDSLVPYLGRSRTPVNSDYFPFVDLNAGKARYVVAEADMFARWTASPLPLIEMLAGDRLEHRELTPTALLARSQNFGIANWMYGRLVQRAALEDLVPPGDGLTPDLVFMADLQRSLPGSCHSDEDPQRWRMQVHAIMSLTLPNIDAQRGREFVDYFANVDCAAQKEDLTVRWMDLYRAVADRNAGAMSADARRLLSASEGLAPSLESYLISAAMLGDIAAGNPDDARLTWNRYGHVAFPNGDKPEHVALLSSIALDSQAPTQRHSSSVLP
jgi:hypothetical protein